MRVDEFDFELPESSIALRPVFPRDSSRLMVVRDEHSREDRRFSDLVDLLRPGDVLVFNDTKVLPVQLRGTRTREGSVAAISATLHTRVSDNRWRAFVKGAKKLKVGDSVRFGDANPACLSGSLDGKVTDIDANAGVVFSFELSGPVLDEAIYAAGAMPLPPYIASKRPADLQDREDYQTIYAQKEGAVAAPTAGLHFTSGLMDRLKEAGITAEFVTLHVGPGTFLPVKVEETDAHRMHSEYGEISSETADRLNSVRAAGGRIVCVGTTSLRLLESATDANGNIAPFMKETDIFITPGYQFRAVDLLITNFHLPRSTLFMLVSAFCGLETMKAAYAHAIEAGYRFYSYGDASLLYRAS